MEIDAVLRWLIGLLFAAIVLLVMRYRLRAQAGESYDLGPEGMAIAVPLRALGLGLWLYLPLYVLLPGPMSWSTITLPAWLRVAAFAFAALAVPPFVHWAQRSLGDNVTTTVITKEDHELVTDGPYRYIRHPLYVAGALFFTAMALAAESWFLLLLLAVGAVVLHARTAKEEAELIKRFGDEYRDYMQRTGRFFPRLGRTAGGGSSDS